MVELRVSVKELQDLAVGFLADHVEVDRVLGPEQTIVEDNGHPADKLLGVLPQGVLLNENGMIPIVREPRKRAKVWKEPFLGRPLEMDGLPEKVLSLELPCDRSLSFLANCGLIARIALWEMPSAEMD